VFALEDEDRLFVREKDLVPRQAESRGIEGRASGNQLPCLRKPILPKRQYHRDSLVCIGLFVCKRRKQPGEFVEKAKAHGCDADDLSIAQ
jgi:hypothetical protein